MSTKLRRIIMLSKIIIAYTCSTAVMYSITVTSHEHHGISNHQQLECLFNSLFMLNMDKTKKSFHHWLLVSGIYMAVSPHKGPVMWKPFPYPDVITEVDEVWSSQRILCRNVTLESLVFKHSNPSRFIIKQAIYHKLWLFSYTDQYFWGIPVN